MNSIVFLKLFRTLYRHPPKFPKWNSRICAMKKPVAPFGKLLFGTFFTVKLPDEIKEEIKVISEHTEIATDHVIQIKQECISSEMKINDLIKTLQSAITETCEKYRACLQKQAEILEKGKTKDPLDEYWDCLVPIRVEANNLKRDFESYRSMIEYVGQLAFNLAFCSAVISNLDSKDYVCNEYFELEKISKEQMSENKKMEELLLNTNMQNIILNTPNNEKKSKDVTTSLKKRVQSKKDSIKKDIIKKDDPKKFS